ncbi:MAG: lysostaphin resistance A-like protein [Lachnospiraceae bacterium]
MKKFIWIFLKIIIFFITWALLSGLAPLPEISSPVIWRLFAELFPLLTVIIVTVVFWLIEKRQLVITIVKKPLKETLIGFGTGVIWVGISATILLAVGVMKIDSLNNIPFLGIWILAAFLNVIMQELLFRGYMYQLIKSKYNLVAATVVTTILFSAMHGGVFEAGVIPVLNVITMSLFMTAVLEYTQSLFVPIIIHGVWNIVGSIVFGAVSLASDYPHLLNTIFRGNEILSGGNVKMEGSIVVLILNLLLTSLFVFFIKKKKRQQIG